GIHAQSMAYLAGQGVDTVAELGPGTVLTGLWRSARRHLAAAPAQAAAAASPPVPAASPAAPAASPAAPAASPPAPAASPAASTSTAETPPAPPASAGHAAPGPRVRSEELGSAGFRHDYGVRLAY